MSSYLFESLVSLSYILYDFFVSLCDTLVLQPSSYVINNAFNSLSSLSVDPITLGVFELLRYIFNSLINALGVSDVPLAVVFLTVLSVIGLIISVVKLFAKWT